MGRAPQGRGPKPGHDDSEFTEADAPPGWSLRSWLDVVDGMGALERSFRELNEGTMDREPVEPEVVLANVRKMRQALDFIEVAAFWDAPR
jgi:hypothetical protein